MRLVALMVVKDEAGRYLTPTIRAAREFCDQVFVYDDWSLDTTVVDASRAGAYVKVREQGEPSFTLDERGFRAAAWKQMARWLMLEPDDMVLSIDADEFLVDTGEAGVRACIERLVTANPQIDAYSFPVHEVWGRRDGQWVRRIDGEWARQHATRLYRWRPGASFGPDSGGGKKNRNLGSVPWTGRDRVVLDDPILLHYGYATPTDRSAKYQRYKDARMGHSPTHIASIVGHAKVVPLSVPSPVQAVDA